MPATDSGADQLRLELYKALLEESRLHREKVSAIWLQKFALLGATIAFLVTKFSVLDEIHVLSMAVIIAIPAIAVLLDIKSAEFAAHANVIDRFIMRRFTDPAILGEWERVKWNIDSNGEESALVKFRTGATVAVTAGPTCVIAVLAGLAIGRGCEKLWVPLAIAGVFCGFYLALTWLGSHLMFRHTRHSASRRAAKA